MILLTLSARGKAGNWDPVRGPGVGQAGFLVLAAPLRPAPAEDFGSGDAAWRCWSPPPWPDPGFGCAHDTPVSATTTATVATIVIRRPFVVAPSDARVPRTGDGCGAQGIGLSERNEG
ncbi:hypothetical protein ADK59_32760 [Streptomyces sp. XY332]|nr:hypothetical protein ADK59_32760 [Streptomyces sp. XY332]